MVSSPSWLHKICLRPRKLVDGPMAEALLIWYSMHLQLVAYELFHRSQRTNQLSSHLFALLDTFRFVILLFLLTCSCCCCCAIFFGMKHGIKPNGVILESRFGTCYEDFATATSTD